MNRPKIAILGGGFAGISAAKSFSNEYEVALVDKRSSFEWTPNIHELLSDVKSPSELAIPYRALVESNGQRFLQKEVRKVNVKNCEVQYDSGLIEMYDAIILALGHQPEHYGIRGAKANTHPFKTIKDVLQIKQLIEGSLSNSATSVTVVGGGFTGLEVIGELLRTYKDNQKLTIQLVEKEQRLLGKRENKVSDSIINLCEKNGVKVYLDSEISSFTKDKIHFAGNHRQSLKSDINIWTAGTSCSPFTGIKSLTGTASGSFANQYLQAHDANDDVINNIFIAGDLASVDKPQAKQAYHALKMGHIAAENCMRLLEKRPLKRYSAQPEFALLSFGDLNTYAVSPFVAGSSPVLAAAKESVFQLQMANLSRGLPIHDQLGEIYQRYLAGVKNLALPQMKNFNPINILTQSRLLRGLNR